MLEKFDKRNQLQNPEPKELTISDPREERSWGEEPLTEAQVTVAEAYNLRSEPEPRQGPGTASGAKTSATPSPSSRPAESVPAGGGAAAAPAKEQIAPLFSQDETQEFRARWDAIQVGFVDEPRRSVEQADSLVAETMRRLAEIFADERDRLEHDWDRGADISTEDLRVALRRYRSFFGRLLSM